MKKLLRRHKSVLIALGIYWPFLFWLTHIPVPQVARQSGMSDKTMHVLAYFILTFLIWFAISPYEKIRWNKLKCWIVAGAVILYGVFDELLQAGVGRSADIRDLAANIFGVSLGMGLLTIFGFWSSLLTVSSIFIFVLSNMSRLMTLPQYTFYATAFHFTAYTAFTLIWIQWLDRFSVFVPGRTGWLIVSVLTPGSLIMGIKLTAPFYDRPFDGFNTAIAIFGITSAVLISWGLFKFSRKSTQSQ